MQYRRDKKGNELSVLGYGCMRFTKNGSSVDLDKAEKEVMVAIKAGVNYFDTAYVYAGNEAAVGEILDRNHCREQIYLATKLPHYLIKSVAGAEKMFQEELRRLKTDYIDYYLMHMLTDIPTWEKLKKIGMQDWIEEKLASGRRSYDTEKGTAGKYQYPSCAYVSFFKMFFSLKSRTSGAGNGCCFCP